MSKNENDKFHRFLTYQKGVCKAASKSTISRWIESLVRWVYDNSDKRLGAVRAHDTRILSTTWALFNGATVTEFINVTHWSSENTFTSFYMKDVPTYDARFARSAILETAKRRN